MEKSISILPYTELQVYLPTGEGKSVGEHKPKGILLLTLEVGDDGLCEIPGGSIEETLKAAIKQRLGLIEKGEIPPSPDVSTSASDADPEIKVWDI